MRENSNGKTKRVNENGRDTEREIERASVRVRKRLRKGNQRE
jgi:hypothetical protein